MSNDDIQRIETDPRRSRTVVYNGMVFVGGMTADVRISEFADSDFIKSRTLVSLIRGQFSRSVFQVCC